MASLPENFEGKFEAWIEMIRAGTLPYQAARRVGLTPQQIQAHVYGHPDRGDRATAAIQEFAETVEQEVLDIAMGRNPDSSPEQLKAALAWLKARSTSVWGDPERTLTVRHELQLTSDDDILELQERLRRRELPYVDADVIAES